MINQKKLISVVIPAYNEEQVVDELAKQLQTFFAQNLKYDFEVIITENGSFDSTYEKLLRIHEKDNRFKILQMSRTFYSEGGITAGLNYARGDAAVIMMADLQDPPQVIAKFIEKWEQGYENVYGIINKRAGVSMVRDFNSKLFYWIINKMTNNLVIPHVSDFRLVDRKVYEMINSMTERNRFMRGMFCWVGFKSLGVPFERAERFAGESKAYFFDILKMAIRSIFIYSYLPLRFIIFLGLFISASSFAFLIYTVIIAFTRGVPFSGYGTLVSIITFMFGVLFLVLGIISEYIALIFDETKQRPNFIVKNKIGFDDNN